MVSFTHLLLVMVIIAFTLDSAFSSPGAERKSLQVTEALKEKWGIIYDLIESDNDGIVSVEEIRILAERIIHFCDASEDLIPGIMQIWHLYIDVIDAYFGVDNTKTGLTRSEWETAFGWYWSNHFDLLERRIDAFYMAVFPAIDTDNDGVVNFKEFQPYYQQYGVTQSVKENTRNAFQLIDADNDGVISEDEFHGIYLTYFLDADVTATELPLFYSQL